MSYSSMPVPLLIVHAFDIVVLFLGWFSFQLVQGLADSLITYRLVSFGN